MASLLLEEPLLEQPLPKKQKNTNQELLRKKQKNTNKEYFYFNPVIEVEDSFARRGLDQTTKSFSHGLKVEVEIQEAYLTKYIEKYLETVKSGFSHLDETTKVEILDTSLNNFHTLVNFFFYQNNIVPEKNGYPLYLPMYSVIDNLFRNKKIPMNYSGIKKNDMYYSLLESLYNKYDINIKYIFGEIETPKNIPFEDKVILFFERNFFSQYISYEKSVKEKRKNEELFKNVNPDKFNNPNLDYDVAFDTAFYGGKKKRGPHKKTTRKHKKTKRKQCKGKSRKNKH
uniref:Uncharacterized protein n=1 Tax=viral metagenome TaxID=1070528 RepID=A0A6C0DHM9_9ZZZZ